MITALSQEQVEKLLIGKWKCRSKSGVWAFEFKYNHEFEQTLVESDNFFEEFKAVFGGRGIKGRWHLHGQQSNAYVLSYTFEQYSGSMYKYLGTGMCIAIALIGSPLTWATVSMAVGISALTYTTIDPIFMFLVGKKTPLYCGIIEINNETQKQEFSQEIIQFTRIN